MITYDRESDIIYVYFEGGPQPRAARTVPLDDDRIVDYAADGTVIGLELLGASQGISLDGVPERERVERELAALRSVLQVVTAGAS